MAAALLLLSGFGFILLASQTDSGGYFSSPAYRFTTSTATLKSDEIAVEAASAHAADPSPDIGELARVRIVVRSTDPHARIFVGIGPTDQVETYLRGSSYDEFRAAELSPFSATFRRVPGTAQAKSPSGRPFWVATSAGSGTRTLTWNKSHGTWSIVVMRLDGAPGVDVRASIGLRFGFLVPAGIGMLVGGTLLLVGALALRRRTPVKTAG
jgi:hypothetical protein